MEKDQAADVASEQKGINEQLNVEAKEPSPEELKAMKEDMLKHYEEQLPFLMKQAEYEEALAKIEEARFRRIRAQASLAQMFGPSSSDNENMGDGGDDNPPLGSRKLRREE